MYVMNAINLNSNHPHALAGEIVTRRTFERVYATMTDLPINLPSTHQFKSPFSTFSKCSYSSTLNVSKLKKRFSLALYKPIHKND
jgi:hypothetical protein